MMEFCHGYGVHNASCQAMTIFHVFFFPCGNYQEQRVVYNTGTNHILVQGPDGLPMAVPVQGKAAGSTIQGSFKDPQKGQPQVIPMPIPGVVGNQPQAGSLGLVNG